MIPLEGMDIIMIGGGAYRKWGKDVDIRLQIPDHEKASFPLDTPSIEIKLWVQNNVDIRGACALVNDLIEQDVPIDGGVTVFIGNERKTVLFNVAGITTEIVDFRVFPWCYYIQRGC
jgi:hypothetical protein